MHKNFDESLVVKVVVVSALFKVVLIDRLAKEGLYGREECARNIFLIDGEGDVLWQVSSDFDFDGGAFTNIIFTEGRLQGYRWDGGMYDIDLATGKAEPGLFMR